MPLRFKVLITTCLVGCVLLWGQVSDFGQFRVALGGLIGVCVVSLWPNEGRGERVERDASLSSWPEAGDIESVAQDFSKSRHG